MMKPGFIRCPDLARVSRKSGVQDRCAISIKKDEGDYLSAWDALKTYMQVIYRGFCAFQGDDNNQVERSYMFPMLGERNKDEV